MSIRVPVLILLVLAGARAFAADPPPAAGDGQAAPAKAAAPVQADVLKAVAAKDSIDLKDIRAFTAVYSLVKQAYVDDIDDHRLMQAAIRGLLAGLDPHSEYLGKEQLDDP